MKKAIFTVLATMFAIASQAQNRAIDALADKYADSDGVTVVNMEGDALKSFSRNVAGGGMITLDNGEKHNLSELLEEIVSVTAIVMRRASESFSAEVRGALDAVRYSPIVSHNEGGKRVRVMSADIRRGKLRGNKEIVAMVDGDGEMVLVRLIGRVDTDLLARLAADAVK